MKKATYRLTIEFDNGDKLSFGGITQTRAYATLKKWEDRYWAQEGCNGDTRYVTRWKLDTNWQEIND